VQGDLAPDGGGQKNVYLAGLDFLQVAGADVGQFRQLVLRQTPRATLAAHVCAKGFQPRLFLFVEHDILHRAGGRKVNVAMDR
jgi:hypothetical protein